MIIVLTARAAAEEGAALGCPEDAMMEVGDAPRGGRRRAAGVGASP